MLVRFLTVATKRLDGVRCSHEASLRCVPETLTPGVKWLGREADHLLDVCVTVHHQYNDVSNQQDATTFSFINLFK
jgi:hypothetical protein